MLFTISSDMHDIILTTFINAQLYNKKSALRRSIEVLHF